MSNARNNFVFRKIKPDPTRYVITAATAGKDLETETYQTKNVVNTSDGYLMQKVFINSTLIVQWRAIQLQDFITRNHQGHLSLAGSRHLGP